MKASKAIMVLLSLAFCQCASYKLYQKDEYLDGKLVERTTYKYDDGQLSSEVNVKYFSYNGTTDRSFSTIDYQVRKTASGIDSIEMHYGTISDTTVYVRSFNQQGVIQSTKKYLWKWNGREEIGKELYDSKGELIEEEYGIYHIRYIRDSLNRLVVSRTERAPNYLETDSTFYSFDGRYTTVTKRNWNNSRGLTNERKIVYEPDIKGLIIMDSTALKVMRYEYELDGKGRIESRTVNITFADNRPDQIWKNIYRYDHKGRKTYIRSYDDFPANSQDYTVLRKVYRLGRLVKEREMNCQDGEMTLSYYRKYRYNLLGQLIERKYQDSDCLEITKYTYKHQPVGHFGEFAE